MNRRVIESGIAFVLICVGLVGCADQEPVVPAALTDLYEQAAAGNAIAQLDLGIHYATGDNIKADESVALRWIGRAAEQGLATAQYELGSYYTLEDSRDDGRAEHWLRLAAEQGHALAQFSLGMLYVAGRGVSADFSEAYAWLSLAADQGDVEAMQIRTAIANAMPAAEFQHAQSVYQERLDRLSTADSSE